MNVLGGKSVFVETTDVNKFKITPEQLRAAITDKTKVFILNTPSNPTGMVYAYRVRSIGQVIEESGILVISDEIYEKLIYNGEHVSIATLSDKLKEQTILINGVSKAYSMTVGVLDIRQP